MKDATDTNIQPSTLLHCPLVQNAECGHLHHVHCLRVGNNSDDTSMTSCPSGCPSATFPREASLFYPIPRIIVAWDGDKIDYVPIPAQSGLAQNTQLQLTLDEVVTLIRKFLSNKGFALPGLFLRIHSRDVLTETVQFTQSSLVSVCHGSTHVHRFELFPGQTDCIINFVE